MTRDQLHPLKYSYDTLGEESLNRLDDLSPPAPGELPRNKSRVRGKEGSDDSKGGGKVKQRDLYELLKEHHDQDEVLGRLWREVNTIPDWVDWDQIARGQEVFYRYGGPALTALAYQSLLGGMGAARVTEVLARTGGFSTKVAKQRMYETTQHILQVTSSLSSIQPGGAGFASTIRVRLLHAAVRRRILALSNLRPDYYSVADFGIPINDLDSIATIATFSATLIWLGIPRQGIWLREQEIEDYIALWRLVAHYIGTPTTYFSSPKCARAIMESILITEVNPSPTSRILANNIIQSLHNQSPSYASRDFLSAGARWLNGNELGDALGLPRPSFYYWALVAGQCLFFIGLTFLRKTFSAFDRRGIRTLRRVLPALIKNKDIGGLGGETVFEFKYIPEFETVTSLGEYDAGGIVRPRGVERRNLVTLLVVVIIVGGVLGAIGWLWMKFMRKLVGFVGE